MQNKAEQDRNQEATVYLGNLDERASDAMVWELMLQAGPVSNVFLPKDRISMSHQGFGFCEFMSEQDADYAVKIMNQIKLFGKPIRVNKASYDKKELAVGANLFVGSLDPSVDEQTLFDTFSTFGSISEHPKIARDPTTGESKGYAFIAYNDFESSDMAIENMNGQFFGGRQISVQYAFKKDGKGERHGSDAERLLAAQAKKNALLSATGPSPYSFQGQFAGVLSTQTAPPPSMSAQSYAPPPPPGIPVYQPPAQQQQGYAQYPPPAQSYGQQQQQYGYPAAAAGQNGYGAPPPPPPAGFGVNGMPQQQQYQAVPGQGAPPPPPIRMGFNGQ